LRAIPPPFASVAPVAPDEDSASEFANLNDSDIAIISMRWCGLSYDVIAAKLGTTRGAIIDRINHTGLDRYAFLTPGQLKGLTIARWQRLKHKALIQAETTLTQAGPYQATMIAAVAQDKAQALEAPAPSREIVDEVTLTLRRVSRGAGTTTCSVRDAENYLSEGETQKH